jgi:hypothetical protein
MHVKCMLWFESCLPEREMRGSGIATWSLYGNHPSRFAAARLGKSSPIGESRRRIGCIRRNCRLLVDPEAKEARSIPVRTGDRPRDGGEALVGGLAPDKAIRNNCDGVPLSLEVHSFLRRNIRETR